MHPNKLAFLAANSILGAGHSFDLQVQGTAVRVERWPSLGSTWPMLPGKRALDGLEEANDGPWPPPVVVVCDWGNGRGSVQMELRLDISRARGPYEGHLALHLVTLPSNRQLVWINLTARLRDALESGQTTCVIPANISLWTRAGERSARPLTDALMKAAASAGLSPSAPTQLRVFDVALPSGQVSPPPLEVFERLLKTALLKLPFVTRGENSDIQGGAVFDIDPAVDKAAESPPAAPVVEQEPTSGDQSPAVPEASASSQENLFFDFLGCHDFGPFEHFEWDGMANLNVIVGENDTGKSHLMKLMYALARGVEDVTLDGSSSGRRWAKVLAEKLVSTFEPEDGKLGLLVHRSGTKLFHTSVEATLCNEDYSFAFGPDAMGSPDDFSEVADQVRPQPRLHALFLPPKEVLTSLDAIAMVRGRRIPGFDDTYFDVAVALRAPPIQAVLPVEMQAVLASLDELLGGRIVTVQGRFLFERGSEHFGMSQTAEGIKKIGILARLIQNEELRRGSILFIDEPEVNLHPRAARALVRMLFDLSRAGVQIFAATHSYFVLKEMEMLARERKEAVMLCSLSRSDSGIEASFNDLQGGLPETGIGREALAQYDDDVEIAWRATK
jgi:energy-coupling factor transporter ATP-binding protein EcfA2